MSNEANTPKKAVKARLISSESVESSNPEIKQPSDTQTFQLLNFPVRLASRLNATADFLEIKRLDFVMRILEAALEEMEVEQMQQKLRDRWSEWCDRHKPSP
jgi:hypothetical protein